MMLKDQGIELEVEHTVIKVLSDYFPAGRRKVEADSRLVEDLEVDSISLVEIVMALNDTFEIELPEDEVGTWKGVKDIFISVKSVIELNPKT